MTHEVNGPGGAVGERRGAQEARHGGFDGALRRIHVFDTTLRDGEQSPGCSMTAAEKLQMARQLARLGVDVIEAGFPAASQGDFEGVRRIALEAEGPTVAALCRAKSADIVRAARALAGAPNPRIHTFIATSDIHLASKLRMTREQVLRAAVAAVEEARSHVQDVEFSCEDATRTDPAYLCEVLAAALEAGAQVLNIPDTVGCALPRRYEALVRRVRRSVPGIERATLSVHCHDDLGLAVANTLAGLRAGAGQVECTINGIGERAGNAALEEIVMAIELHQEALSLDTGVRTELLYPTSSLLSRLTGVRVQPHKAIVGDNAFAHEAGIHQDGVLKNVRTYEILSPASVGAPVSRLVLGKHSGKHAIRSRLRELGYALGDGELEQIYVRFCDLADRKKEVTERDLVALVEDAARERERSPFHIQSLQVVSGTGVQPAVTVAIAREGWRAEASATGDGPVDAVCRAIAEMLGVDPVLESYELRAVGGGSDALGEARVQIALDGSRYVGQATDTDIVLGSARAYLSAAGRAWLDQRTRGRGSPPGNGGPPANETGAPLPSRPAHEAEEVLMQRFAR
jgi:2-isopropylmalate synthase